MLKRLVAGVFAAIFVLVSTASVSKSQPSFDCSKATLPDELVICQTPQLAELDNIVSAGYEYLKGTFGERTANQIGHRLWKARVACKASATCILQEQIDAIRSYKSFGAPVSVPDWAYKAGDIAEPPPSLPSFAATPSRPPAASQSGQMSSGTGIVVSTDGRVLTNNHVVDGCEDILIRRADAPLKPAVLLYADKGNDLALLKIGDTPTLSERDVAHIRTAPSVRNGEDVAVYGFPLTGALSSSGNVTRGNISALTGLRDDTRFFQLTAPIQAGNSGGPLLDHSANVVGVVNSKLNELAVAEVTGSLPQNVNFAIKTSVAMIFLEAHNVNYQTALSDEILDLPAIAEIARRFTVLVVCR